MSSENNFKSNVSGSILKIQNLEDYLYDNNRDNIPPPPLTDFPKLFKVKLDKQIEDDIDSKISGLQVTPELALYTNLLLANYYESMKNNEK